MEVAWPRGDAHKSIIIKNQFGTATTVANLSYDGEQRDGGYRRATWSQINFLIWGHCNARIRDLWSFPFLSPCKMSNTSFCAKVEILFGDKKPTCPQKANASSGISVGWFWQPPCYTGKDHELEQLAVSPGKQEFKYGSTWSRKNTCNLVTALSHSQYRKGHWEFPKQSRYSLKLEDLTKSS